MNARTFKVGVRVLLVAVVAVCLLFTLSTFTQNKVSKKNIMFIAKSSESNFWKTAFQGAQAAANEYNVNLTIKAPQTEDDYAVQNQLIQWGVDNKMDAIVFSACDFDRSVERAEHAMEEGIPVISVDSPINSQKVQMMIGTNNIVAGAQVGEELARLTGQQGIVGVINCEEIGAVGIQREAGLLEALKKYPQMKVVDIRYTISNVEDPKRKTLEMLAEHPDINAIATFNEWTTLGVGEALEELNISGSDYAVVGFDTNIKSIEQLENGIYDALIVQNPFAMGYMGVQQALEYKKNAKHEAFIDTGTTVITAQNMYNMENQKLLFPFSN